jgi:hypothetical protein
MDNVLFALLSLSVIMVFSLFIYLLGVNAAALCPAVDVVNCPYIDGIGVHM